jgi:putative phosphoserine phosphatase / 1-acylglycerol-3-phosphate O-acyltransferase
MEPISSRDSSTPKNYIAFFDLDQTLADSISGKELARAAYHKGIMKNTDLLNAVWQSLAFRFNLTDPAKLIDKMASWTRGMPEQTMIDLCSEVSVGIIIPSIYKDAVTEIEFHKEKNAKLVILSSALKKICEEIGNSLGFDDILCSELEVSNGYLTGYPLGHLCFGDEKSVRLLEYCKKNNCSPSDAWYYGDSISDLPALSAVGNPVCVNPDKKLKKMSHIRGWKTLIWKS